MALKIKKPILSLGPTGPITKGTVIFLHGSGDTGKGICDFINHFAPNFKFPHLKILLPTAPMKHYTPNEGMLTSVWFDRYAISKKVPEMVSSIDATAEELMKIIHDEVASGILVERIVVGGFSMGGAMALHLGYRFCPNVAGVFAMSSFLNNNSVVYKINKDGNLPPLFQSHGTRDDMVPFADGVATFEELKSLGISGQFRKRTNDVHELSTTTLYELKDWINKLIPEL